MGEETPADGGQGEDEELETIDTDVYYMFYIE